MTPNRRRVWWGVEREGETDVSNLYRVSTSPTHDVLTLAEKRGMKLGDGTSVWDWIEDAECEKFSPTTSRFSAACAVARSDAKRDICGEARIQEVVWVKWRDAPASWEGRSDVASVRGDR